MGQCVICGKVEPGYVIGNGWSFCEDCYWEIKHDDGEQLIKSPFESFKLSEWLSRMSIVAKKKGF